MRRDREAAAKAGRNRSPSAEVPFEVVLPSEVPAGPSRVSGRLNSALAHAAVSSQHGTGDPSPRSAGSSGIKEGFQERPGDPSPRSEPVATVAEALARGPATTGPQELSLTGPVKSPSRLDAALQHSLQGKAGPGTSGDGEHSSSSCSGEQGRPSTSPEAPPSLGLGCLSINTQNKSHSQRLAGPADEGPLLSPAQRIKLNRQSSKSEADLAAGLAGQEAWTVVESSPVMPEPYVHIWQ